MTADKRLAHPHDDLADHLIHVLGDGVGGVEHKCVLGGDDLQRGRRIQI